MIPERLPKSVKGLIEFIEHLNSLYKLDNLTILEIGSWTGLSAVEFAKKFKKVICLDPWSPTSEINTLYSMGQVYNLFCERIEDCNNVEVIRDTSQNLDFTKLKNIDIVYIDGLHNYEGVRHDIEKSKGLNCKIISGHDYCNKFPGVMKAVNELLGKPEKVFSDTSWFVRMK